MSEKKKKEKKEGILHQKKKKKMVMGITTPITSPLLKGKDKKSKREKGEKRDFSMGTQNWRKREKREEMLSHGARAATAEEMLQ